MDAYSITMFGLIASMAIPMVLLTMMFVKGRKRTN